MAKVSILCRVKIFASGTIENDGKIDCAHLSKESQISISCSAQATCYDALDESDSHSYFGNDSISVLTSPPCIIDAADSVSSSENEHCKASRRRLRRSRAKRHKQIEQEQQEEIIYTSTFSNYPFGDVVLASSSQSAFKPRKMNNTRVSGWSCS